MKKRLLSAIVSLCLLLTMVPTVAFAADEDNVGNTSYDYDRDGDGELDSWNVSSPTNSEGDVVYAYLTKNSNENYYTLVIDGSGAIKDFAFDWTTPDFPWKEFRSNICEVTIGDRITRIGNYLLTYADMPVYELDLSSCSSLKEIGNMYDCGKLEKVIFPASIEKITGFNTCTNLKTVDFSRCSQIQFGTDAFAYCLSLEKIDLSSLTMEALPNTMFYGCANLKEIKWPTGLKRISYLDFSGAAAPYTAPCFNDGRLVLPEGITEIDTNAFANNKSLRNIVLPSTLETIGSLAFNSTSLVDVHVPQRVTQVNSNAFTNLPDGSIIYIEESNKDCLSSQSPSESKYTDNKTSIAVINGGTFPDDTVFEAGKLATPVKEGSTFRGWYESSSFSGSPVTDATAGQTYYAKWIEHPSTLTTNIGEQKFVVGEPTEFTFTTTANDDANTMVIGTSNFSDADAIDKLEYLESKDGKWYELKGDFGPSTGFPMSDATSKFRVTFKKGGNYTFTASMKKVDGGDVLCSTNAEFAVEKKTQNAPVAPTLKDRTYTSITLYEVADSSNSVKAEYSKDGGVTWQNSPEFTDLTSGTTYTFAVRYAETDTYNASEIVTDDFATLRHSSGGSSSSSTPTNTVSASTASNGKVSLDKSTAKKGDTVTVTVTPDAGYQLDKLTVTDAKGKTIAVTKKSDSKYTFTMPDSKVTITPTFSKIEDTKPSKNGFDDVASSAWYADAVKYVTDKGLMNGTGSNTFSPSASTTRGMLMTVLARYAGEDTTGGATWYEKGMNWAKANGVSDGTNPTVNITREQLVTMLYRYAGSPAANGSLDSFSGASTVSTYAVNAMQWAVENGIVNGSNGKLNPKNNATRAEVAAILMRFCEMSK